MKQLLVISGKGGTGKTSLSGAFAALAAPLVLVDCDVDAANLYLLAGAQGAAAEEEPFTSGYVAQVEAERCTGCGVCAGLCRFDAVTTELGGNGQVRAHISELACEGCGVCVDNCPSAAIKLEDRLAGSLLNIETRFGPLAYGELLAGQPNSGKLVVTVRSRAKALAEARGYGLVLVDGPPGVGCPVIASMGSIDLAVIVAEPTASSIHDMERVLKLCDRFQVCPAVVVNKADINAAKTAEIKAFCEREGVALLGAVDFDPAFTQAMVNGETIIEAQPASAAARSLTAIWQRVKQELEREHVS